MKRYRSLDRIRGVTLISMILYHMIWDLVYLFGWDLKWFQTETAFIWQQSICWTFILLSGFCFPFGRRKLRRGLTVFTAGLLLMAATGLVVPESKVVFGILTLLGSCMLFLIPAEQILRKVNPCAGLSVSLLLFFVLREVNSGYVGFGGWRIASVPGVLYRNLFTAYLGFPYAGFSSTDYFSIIPWIFLFIAGYYLHGLCKKKGLFDWLEHSFLEKGRRGWIEWIGRHSLELYILHQPVMMAVLSLLF